MNILKLNLRHSSEPFYDFNLANINGQEGRELWDLGEVVEQQPFFNARTLYLEKHRVGLGKCPEAPAANQALSRSL